MSTFHKLHVHALDGNSISHRVTLDGRPVRCRSLDMHLGVDETPTATIEVLSVSDAEELAEAGVMYHPNSVAEALAIVRGACVGYKTEPDTKQKIITEAHAIIRGALLADPDLRAAWESSIQGALIDALVDAGDMIDVDDLSKVVVDRIIGDDL